MTLDGFVNQQLVIGTNNNYQNYGYNVIGVKSFHKDP